MTNGSSVPTTPPRANPGPYPGPNVPKPRPKEVVSAAEITGAGVTAGLLAGLVMLVAAMIGTAVAGEGLWRPAKLVATLYYGTDAIAAGAGAVVIMVGVLTHLAVAVLFGILFAFLTRGRLDATAAVFAGLVYGLAVGLLMTYLVVPWTAPTMLERLRLDLGWLAVFHLLYGLTLSVSPGLVRSLHRRNALARERRMPAPRDPLRA